MIGVGNGDEITGADEPIDNPLGKVIDSGAVILYLHEHDGKIRLAVPACRDTHPSRHPVQEFSRCPPRLVQLPTRSAARRARSISVGGKLPDPTTAA
jgi:hypothetical protein